MLVKPRKFVARVVGFAAIATVLSGCGPTADISARIVDGRLETAFCSPYSYDALLVSDQNGRELAWSIEGTWPGEAVVIPYGEVPEGMTEVVAPRELKFDDGFLLIEYKRQGATYFVQFHADEIDEGWVSSSKGSRAEACE